MTVRRSRAVWAAVVLGVATLVLGGVASSWPRRSVVESSPGLRFEPDRFVMPTPMGWSGNEEFEYAVEVVNASDRDEQITGADEFCSSACFGGVGLPVTVPARGRARVRFVVGVRQAGRIADELNFFTTDPASPRLPLKIVGFVPDLAAFDGPGRPDGP